MVSQTPMHICGLTMLAQQAQIAARAASENILRLYRKNNSTTFKSDGSPLTAADQASHEAIARSLEETGIPIVSEEGEETAPVVGRYWLVDPLDGTKDFLAANDEFTVNIALVENGRPVLGVVYAPALDELYVGIPGGAVWWELRGVRTTCGISPKGASLRMAASRFHDHPDTEVFAEANNVGQITSIGAALKYGRLAAAEIDVYPRVVGTSEWDTAAGQAVLEAAGGSILDWQSREPLRYGKPGRRNGKFLAFRAPYQIQDFSLMTYREQKSVE